MICIVDGCKQAGAEPVVLTGWGEEWFCRVHERQLWAGARLVLRHDRGVQEVQTR